ncbi:MULTISPECIES: hypothetical protein [unclassified Variovorax]|uniref:hypothetical protein n=1 Tax=unclassified Variovorax TaxID=663243 RepID=UPI003F4562B5
MNGHNQLFRADPVAYAQLRAINGVSWFMQNAQAQQNPAFAMQVLVLNTAKMGSFDLQGTAQALQVTLRPVGNVLHQDQPISAYWCPFIQGNVMPGFVDVPRHNPQHRFVFTAAMNGCALMVTNSPLGAHLIRVYHHQHPGQANINQMIQAQGQEVISYIGFDDYGHANQHIPLPNAFNFLYYRNGAWKYVLQPQLFDPLTNNVTLNGLIPSQVLDATF